MASFSKIFAVVGGALQGFDEGAKRHWSPNQYAFRDYLVDDGSRYPLTCAELKQVCKKANMSGWEIAKSLLFPVAEISPVLGAITVGGERAIAQAMRTPMPVSPDSLVMYALGTAFYAAFVALTFSKGIEDEKKFRRILAEKVIKEGRPKGAVPGLLKPMGPQDYTVMGIVNRNGGWLNKAL